MTPTPSQSPSLKGLQVKQVLLGSQTFQRTADLRKRQKVQIEIGEEVRVPKELVAKRGGPKSANQGPLQVSITYKAEAFQGTKKRLTVLEGELEYTVVFELEKRLTSRAIHHLFSVVAPLTAWPYLRRYIHHTLPEMGLPPILLPIRQASSRIGAK